MKMTKNQAKLILIVGWSIFAGAYLATILACLSQHKWLYVTILCSCGWCIVTEYRRYIERLKKKKLAKSTERKA